MVTTVTKSIGSAGGRDYSTVHLWDAGSPANLVTDDKVWQGDLYNDSEFTGTSNFATIAAVTADATRYKELKCAAGQSFRDHASVQTNPLRYDQSKGVGLRRTAGSGGPALLISANYTKVRGLQVKMSATYGGAAIGANSGATNLLVENCLLEMAAAGAGDTFTWAFGSDTASTMRNCVMISRAANSTGGFLKRGVLLNCTIVSTRTNTSGNAISSTYTGTGVVKNCALFGFFGFTTGSGFTYTTCMTDKASPPSGVTGSKTYANQFVDVGDTTPDFRAKAGGDILNAATTDTNATPDIAGTARPQGAAYDIGCWELVVAADVIFVPINDNSSPVIEGAARR